MTEQNQNKILSITIKDKKVLYSSYMPFLKYGGLFIPTSREFSMGEVVELIVALFDSVNKFEVVTKVVWITPTGSQNNKAAGIGVAFDGTEIANNLCDEIAKILGNDLQSDLATHTM